MSSKPTPIVYFQRDQLLVSYRPSGDALLSTSDIVRGLQQRLDRAYVAGLIPVRIRVSGKNTATFRTPNSGGLPQAAVLRLSVSPPNYVISAGRILSPNDNEQGAGGYSIAVRRGSVQINGAGPNWVASGAPALGSAGGPGSSPMPQSGGTTTADFDSARSYPEPDRTFSVPNEIAIFVLDSTPAPSLPVARSIATHAGTMGSSLVKSLIGKTPTLKFDPQNYLSGSPANSSDFLTAPSCVINNQPVLPLSPAHSDESDHGLYVAGIVQMLTQKPNGITLMRVLNRFGVGDSYALLSALGGITRAFKKRPLDKKDQLIPILANLSLFLSFPDFAPFLGGDFSQFDGATVKNLSTADRAYLSRWARLRLDSNTEDSTRGLPDSPVLESLRALYEQRILCVAAAGNDSTAANHKPTRYPAAYRSLNAFGAPSFAVFSAASITKNLTPSSFSNKGDNADLKSAQPTHGVGVWGGEVDTTGSCDPLRPPTEGWLSAGIQKNVALYGEGQTSPTQLLRNADGWLMWAGTSFATPALTAWVARYLSAQLRLKGVVDSNLASIFGALMGTAANIPGHSELGVNYLKVTQTALGATRSAAELERLVARVGFGAPANIVAELLPLSHNTQLERLTAISPLLLSGAETTLDDWLNAMLTTRDPLREKLALFWHGFFAIPQLVGGNDLHMWQRLISNYRTLGAGVLTPLLQSLSCNHAALAHFDAASYWEGHENPHYARELLDRLWGGAYNDADVAALAKLLHARNDPDDGKWSSSTEIAPFLLAKPAARTIARQMWRFLAGTDDNSATALVEQLANVYNDSGYNAQVLARAIVATPEFVQVNGTKSPLDLALGALRELGQTQLPADLAQWLAAMGQDVAAPPVEGWRTGEDWLKPELARVRLDFARALAHDNAFVPPNVSAQATKLQPQIAAAARIAAPNYQYV